MINTYSESGLHLALKSLYQKKFALLGERLEMEKKIGGFWCDLAGEKSVVEIQTAGLSRLRKKLEFLLEKYEVTVVFPVVKTKTILTFEKNRLVSRRKSPKHSDICEIFFNMTGLAAIVPHPRLKIHALEVEVEEERQKFAEKIQLENKSRRHLRDWKKTDKRLLSVGKTTALCKKEDYVALLGGLAKKKFSSAELKEIAGREASPMLWFYRACGFVERIEKRGNSWIYAAKI